MEKKSNNLTRVELDWGVDEDNARRFRFYADKSEHQFREGMEILLSVWGNPIAQPVSATILSIQEEGAVVQADSYVDISEENNIKQI